jgi:quercetin dioxygenase-like cupin family protein
VTRVPVHIVALVGLLAALPLPTLAREATPGATPPPAGFARERLIEEMPGQLDPLGRVPLARLIFAPGAELPADFLAGPLLAVVEAGAFDVQVGAASLMVGPGERIEIADGSAVAAHNTADAEGAWLVLGLRRDQAWFAPGAMQGPPEQDPAPGVVFRMLFPRTFLIDRLFPVRLTLDRVALAQGAMLPSVDLGGPTPTRYVALRVEAGAVAAARTLDGAAGGATPAAGATLGGEAVLRAGDVAYIDAGEDGGVQAVGAEGAVLLLVRAAEDPEA